MKFLVNNVSNFNVNNGIPLDNNFDCTLTIFIIVINQRDALNLFYNKFISCLYMFRALCAHHQVKIVLYSLWYLHTL